MAKHRNRRGKKIRGVPSSMSIRKHRTTGASKTPRIVKVLVCKELNAAHEEDKKRKARRSKMASSVKDLMRKEARK
jgi:hypothetical protein